MTRPEVLQSQGSPPGDLHSPVWQYGDRAVVFRQNKLVQVLGHRVELDGQPQSENDLHRRLGDGKHFDNLYRSSSPLPYRLQTAFPIHTPRPALLLRDRMKETLKDLHETKAPSFDFSCQAGPDELALCADWLEADHKSLRWTPLALRRALWECLSYGEEIWQLSCLQGRTTAYTIATNNWDVEPVHIRLRLLVDAKIRLARQCGQPLPLKIALDEQTEHDCEEARQRLMLGGTSPGVEIWKGYWGRQEIVHLTPGILRFAAAKAKIVDEPMHDHPYLYPGPPEGNWAVGIGLGEYPRGMSGWNWKGAADPDARFDWDNPAHRLHALWTREGAVLKPFDQDRLAPIQQTLQQLPTTFDPGPWTPEWGRDLPADEQQREVLRLIERSPHIGDDIPRWVNHLRRLAALAQTQQPPPLAAACSQILRFGLSFLLD